MPINILVQNRQIKFLTGLCHVDNTVLRFLFDLMNRMSLLNLSTEMTLNYSCVLRIVVRSSLFYDDFSFFSFYI